MPDTSPVNITVTCPRDGSRWYACPSGSNFVGCCKINPCKYGCEKDSLSSPLIPSEFFDTFPDLLCSAGSAFYTCIFQRDPAFLFWGCCKNNACLNSGCASENVSSATMYRDNERNFYTQLQESIPLNLSGSNTAEGPPALSSTIYEYREAGLSGAHISVGLCVALLVAIPVMVSIIICCRRLGVRRKKRSQPSESVRLPTHSIDPKQDNTHRVSGVSDAKWTSNDVRRLGRKTLYILLTSSIVVLGVSALLVFLWFGNVTNRAWTGIMVRNWATRAVSVSALLLRTAIDFQAAIASAILVSLLLESRTGIGLQHLANLSPMRTGSTGPWSFARVVFEDFWRSKRIYTQTSKWALLACILIVTTSTLQFSSTILLSDLKPGPLGDRTSTSQVRNSLSYRNVTRRITRDAAWTTNPPFYPAFGEYTEAIAVTEGISDTGLVLRALLPYATAESRQSLRSYSGKALVLNARVSCQAPIITTFNGTDLYTQLSGIVNATRKSDKMQNITAAAFSCSVAGPNQYSICQLGRPYPSFMGSLTSQFENSSSFGTAFLIIKGMNNSAKSPTQIKHARDTQSSEWLNITFANQTTAGASITICFAPWDAAVMDVNLDSTSNRTEPLLEWWETFRTDAVVNHLLHRRANNTQRQILNMHKPKSYLGELPPRNERPLLQSDASGSSAADYGSNTPLPENWSIFLTGEPLITILNSFSKTPSQVISADPALAAIFTDTLAASNSVAWALSTLITVLSMSNYYSQMPAFDRLDNVDVSFYISVFYPRSTLGLVLLMWTLVVHFLIVALLVIMFVRKTHLTLLGNAWSAFSQMAESPELKEYLRETSMKDDSTVAKELKERNSTGLRARIVRRGDAVEIAVN